MKNVFTALSLIVLIGLGPHDLMSQVSPKELYADNIQKISEIYNGGEYVKFLLQSEGHPFFNSKTFHKAELVYNGIVYDDVLLLYDLVSHDLVTLNPIHNTNIRIQSNRVSRFKYKTELGDFNFVRKDLVSAGENSQNQFLEEINVGKADLYCLHEKKTKEKVEFLDRVMTYDASKKFFVKYQGELQTVNGKNGLFKILPIDKKQAKRSLKEKGIKYKDNPKGYYSDILKTYNASEL